MLNRLLTAFLIFFSSSLFAQNTHPDWILRGNIYEVNVRQYTPEGTFKAFAKHLPRLKAMGVQTLWFMPINPVSEKDRKGSLGSYYAVKNYTQVNPEFGTMGEWKALVNRCHEMGMKVIIDWVPNHTGADHEWLTTHPDFYVKDDKGNFVAPYDWSDVRKLNYQNPVLVDSMIASMKFWITQTGIDGFRCDVAQDVTDTFWKKCIAQLHRLKNIFMLAEGEKKELHEDGFDASYSWSVFNVMKQIVKGERNVTSLDSAINKYDTAYPKNALHLYFTSNHDENSWSLADYGTMPGETHAPFAILTQTIKHSTPLIYSGQEEPVLRAIRFFDKDTINFKNYSRNGFYKTLLALRKRDPALNANASFKKIDVGDDSKVYAYLREKDGKKVLVVLNFSASLQKIKITDASLFGNVLNVFTDTHTSITKTSWSIVPWGYQVFEYE